MLTSDNAESPTDGRVLRGQRNKEAIVDAFLELIVEGILEPTSEEIAERADVGIRSVFRHFRDMDALYGAMDATLEARFGRLWATPTAGGTRAARIAAFVQQRAALYEGLAPYRQALDLRRPYSPFLQDLHQKWTRRARKDLRRWFPELATVTPPLTEAIELAVSFGAWQQLRVEQRLSKRRTTEVVSQTLASLLR